MSAQGALVGGLVESAEDAACSFALIAQQLLQTFMMENMIFAAAELYDFVLVFEVIKTYSTLSRLFEQNITKWEMLDIAH